MNILDINVRKVIIEGIRSEENKRRKAQSLAELEIFNDNITPYVKNYLSSFYSKETLAESPVISCINVCRRVVTQEASIYKERPIRIFTNVTEDMAKTLEDIYAEIGMDSKLLRANQYYKLQRQTHVQLLPNKEGELHLRVLTNHNLDVVPDDFMPEKYEVYVLSGYDKSVNGYNVNINPSSDNMNQAVGDTEDYKASLERYAWWSDEYNFITNGDGIIISGVNESDIINPLLETPIIEISDQKDLEYWQRQGAAVADFTVQFNAAFTDLSQIIRMQGFAQAWFKGAKGSIPQNLTIGTNHVLRLEIDPNNPVETDFGFATPSPDVAGSISYLEMLLSSFLSSRGVDPKTISGKAEADKFSSGIERLLALLDKFEASKIDMAIFEKAEKEIFEVIKKMINTYVPAGILKYNIGMIPEDAGVEVKYIRPEMVQTETDKLALIEKKLELGLISDIEAISIDRDIPLDAAKKIADNLMPVALANPAQQLGPDGQPLPTGGNVDNVQKLALNGAQVASLVDIVEKVAIGTLPRESAVNMITVAFNLDAAQANAVVGSAGNGFKIDAPAPEPQVIKPQGN